MRWLAISYLLAAPTLVAQKPPKIDSVLIRVPLAKDQTIERVGQAFAERGLVVTNASPFFVEAKLGQTSGLFTENERVVRASIFATGDSTTVVLTGEEVRKNGYGQTQLRIDNRAGGNGEKAWCRMVAVALALDSSQVSPEAMKPEKCAKRLTEKIR